MRKAVIVSLDAFYRADVDRLNPEGALAGILRDGTWCRRVETVFPALTYPIHATMVTGCDPDRTGVGQNQPFQPGTPKPMRKWYWERKHIRVPTLFEAVKEAGGQSCSILWPVNCRNRAVRRCLPEVHPLKGENAVWKALRFGTPLYSLLAEKRFGRLRKGVEEPYLSDFAAALAADTVRRHRPDFTAVHLIDLDSARHHHGTFSKEAMAALGRNDRRLEEYSLGRALFVQSNGMSAYFFPGEQPPASPDPEALLTPERQREAGISRLYTRAELDRMHAAAGPLFAAEAAEGVAFSDALDEEKREAATHGFGPGREADLCLFAVYGKGIRKGAEIPAMAMRDVGPTIAGLMGLRLPQADGTDRSGAFLAR